ncbi:unnamed protein product [Moneuplotes crassus]|uniref:Uncharacterized protein n=1 Tax=Euplotes crassus TaxID=5936 RepID=A0AAD1XZR6_EUPCR|nr:unnamed protein product [Moneuplotes crassus]
MENMIYVQVPQKPQMESPVLKNAKSIRNVALTLAIASLLLMLYIFQTTYNAPKMIFYIPIVLNGLLIVYTLFEKWLGFGCFRSFVKVFAWTGFSIAALSGVVIIYSLLVGFFSKPDVLLFYVWLAVIAPIGFLGYTVIFVQQAQKYEASMLIPKVLPSDYPHAFQNRL